MIIFKNSKPLESIERSVVSTGNFDGVHKGHQQLVQTVIERARKLDAASVIITFEPHTRAVLHPDIEQPLLATCAEKEILLGSLGIDALVCLPFTQQMAAMAPEEFIDSILTSQFKAIEWVMGENHSFGRNREGSKKFLHNSKSKKHINVFAIRLSSQQSAVISSTQIRAQIQSGAIEEAVDMLGHAYLIVAKRILGVQTGSTLGFPTLNFSLPPSQKVIPPPGVYAARLSAGEHTWTGACYLGNCPTFGNRDYHIEFHSLSGDGPYPKEGEEAGLWIHSFIRKDESFPCAQRLVENMKHDIAIIRKFFAKE